MESVLKMRTSPELRTRDAGFSDAPSPFIAILNPEKELAPNGGVLIWTPCPGLALANAYPRDFTFHYEIVLADSQALIEVKRGEVRDWVCETQESCLRDFGS